MNPQLKKGALDMCVLALLAAKSNYAYDLVAQLASSLQVSEGTIYPLMRRLQTEAYVSTRLVESESAPPRKYYELTHSGMQELVRMRREWREFAAAVDSIVGNSA